MKLTYIRGKFILEGECPDVGLRSSWKSTALHTYETTSFQAAARFRKYADASTERLFNRVLVKSYALPSHPLPIDLKTILDSHQLKGLKWILTRSRSYLAHSPGAGKTAQAIVASILSYFGGTTVFIVPPTLTVNWEREILKWTEYFGIFPTITIIPLTAKKDSIAWRADFIIVPDSMMPNQWVYTGLLRLKIKFIAIDEASRFKEATATRTKALFGGVNTKTKYKYRGLVQRAHHAVLMDGSPMPNRPMELWAPTYAMAPETIDFMSEQDFGFRYCGPKMNERGQWEFKHSSNEEELHAKLMKSFMNVVSEKDLNHPERRRSMLFMNYDPRSPEMKEWDQKNLGGTVFKELMKRGEDFQLGELATMRRKLGMMKVDWIVKYILERRETKKEQIIVFAWHVEVCMEIAVRLRAAGVKTGLVVGGTKPSFVENWFKEFQSGECEIIVGNIVKMGRGHNLQNADRIIFGEYSWSDELNIQCEKRASRKGSTKAYIPCDYVVAPGTMDEPVLTSVFAKARSVKKIIGG